MNMPFFVMSRLLTTATPLLYAAYVIMGGSLFWMRSSHESPLVFLLKIGCVCLMMLHHYVAFRVKFDGEILEKLSHVTEQELKQLSAELDIYLIQSKLMPPKKAGRDWTLRLQGCFNLFKIQLIIFSLQWLLFMIVLITI